MSPDLQRALDLARLALAFGRVERATTHEDGQPETDTDHTVGLAWIAIELCPPGLDPGLVARFALVHDLPEVYAGDTDTLTLQATPPKERSGAIARKARREAEAVKLLHEELPGSPLLRDLDAYEAQILPEARFVRLLDKVMPKLLHLLTEGAAAPRLIDRVGFIAANRAQVQWLRADYPDPELARIINLLTEAIAAVQEVWPEAVPSTLEAQTEPAVGPHLRDILRNEGLEWTFRSRDKP